MSDKKNVLALIDDDPKILDLTAKYLRDQDKENLFKLLKKIVPEWTL